MIQVRVDKSLKDDVSEIFASLGLDVSTAVRMFFQRCHEGDCVKSDFKRFRFLRRMAIVSVVLAASLLFGGQLYDSLFGWSIAAFSLALGGTFVLMVVGAALILAAWDNLLCPRCGQRSVEVIKRKIYDKENLRRYKAILKGEPMKCACCGAEIKTA